MEILKFIYRHLLGENKKFRRPSNFEYQKGRDLIMSNNNLVNVVILEMMNLRDLKLLIWKMKSHLWRLTSFSRKQLVNRLNKIWYK